MEAAGFGKEKFLAPLAQAVPRFERIEGWLALDAAQELYRLAAEVEDGCIVEIGSYRGRSTVALCAGSRAGAQVPVYAVDPQEPFVGLAGGRFGPEDRAAFFRNFLETGLYPQVRLVNLASSVAAAGWRLLVRLLFLDGDHRYEGVRADWEAWRPRLADQAVVVFNDMQMEGPARLITELVGRGDLTLLQAMGTTASYRYTGLMLGFHGDRYLIEAVQEALAQATLFAETGSNRGVSLAHAASQRPDLPMWSCEPSDEARAIAQRRTERFPRVRISALPSPEALEDLLAAHGAELDGSPVFWLDAHAHGVPLPLGRELEILTRRCARAQLFIDDFEVPGRSWFGYDSYPDGRIGLPYLLAHVDPGREYRLALPAYSERTSRHHPLRGWCCLSWGGAPVPKGDAARLERLRIVAGVAGPDPS